MTIIFMAGGASRVLLPAKYTLGGAVTTMPCVTSQGMSPYSLPAISDIVYPSRYVLPVIDDIVQVSRYSLVCYSELNASGRERVMLDVLSSLGENLTDENRPILFFDYETITGSTDDIYDLVVRAENIPNAVDAGGLDIQFNSSRLEYIYFTVSDEFFETTAVVDMNVVEGSNVLRVGFFDAYNIVPAGTTGELFTIHFGTLAEEQSVYFSPRNFVDDIKTWPFSPLTSTVLEVITAPNNVFNDASKIVLGASGSDATPGSISTGGTGEEGAITSPIDEPNAPKVSLQNIESATITINQDQIHNTIDMQCSDPSVFHTLRKRKYTPIKYGIKTRPEIIGYGNNTTGPDIKPLKIEIDEEKAAMLGEKTLAYIFCMSTINTFLECRINEEGIADGDITAGRIDIENGEWLVTLTWAKKPADVIRVIYWREYDFIVETVTGNERGYSMWGRSPSALEDKEYADEINVLLEDYASAEDTAANMLSVCSLRWELDDYLLPPGFSFVGAPIEGIKRIADIYGAIVRAGAGYEIIVRKKYPVRPVDIAEATADVDYDDIENIFEVDINRELGKKWNMVRISGYSPAGDEFTMEIEPAEHSRNKGSDVIVQIYWPKEELPENLSGYVTQGSVEYLGEKYIDKEASLTFVDGRASVQYPIMRLESATFYPAPEKSLSFTPWQKEFIIEDEDYALSDIEYVTRCQKFRVHSHYVKKLLIAISAGIEDEEVLVWLPEEPENEAPAISDEYLVGAEAKKNRGTAFIDDTRYSTDIIKLNVPYDSEAIDGAIAYINDAGVKLAENVQIKNVSINIGEVAIESSIEVIRWLH